MAQPGSGGSGQVYSGPLLRRRVLHRLFCSFFGGLIEIHRSENTARIPKHLPVFIFSGDMDPVGHNSKGVRRLARMYAKLGLQDVTCKLYPGGRHEMLNETNREEVMQDIIAWLHRRVQGKAQV
ncbi:alpha/beta hydrolase [Paenibacillus sp. P26]|nr:alpha/beta hydrolase [Paenibacillus sp. P26]